MAVAFFAGPLSGLIMQLLIGILADLSTSKGNMETIHNCWNNFVHVCNDAARVNEGVMVVDCVLLVDILPATLQPSGNAWAAQMAAFGSIIGYFVGNLNLPSLLPIFGHTELQILAIVVSLILFGSHVIVAWSVNEHVLVKTTATGAGGMYTGWKWEGAEVMTFPHLDKNSVLCEKQWWNTVVLLQNLLLAKSQNKINM
ncbi:hypothetical protein BT96DRAFT_1082268 [Gymnopus androsaceus JB14]|uniref:Uncharacterized protein n=1 Tax=Gymnopus androsaceus JB14 TaxID=1447944 RepID=A0A6A4GP11_9AGAR|nr:hypothetical protein BT96DRAFT_1082268 [Gymnopus androsaceus JB14]